MTNRAALLANSVRAATLRSPSVAIGNTRDILVARSSVAVAKVRRVRRFNSGISR